MAPSHFSAVSLLLMLTVLPLCIAQNTYYVKPTPDTSCHNRNPCHTLSEYMNESKWHFTYNTTLLFLPGDHILQETITMNNIGRLSFTGNSSSSKASASNIICTNAAFTFVNMSELKFTGLGIFSCQIQLLDGTSAFFENGRFANSRLENGPGGAIYAHNSIVTFQGCSFENNRADYGGALFACNSATSFRGETIFMDNKAALAGGAVVLLKGEHTFQGHTTFASNSAKQGGGIYTSNGFMGFSLHAEFINNSADWGGAVYVGMSYKDANSINSTCEMEDMLYTTTVSFEGNSTFTDNKAQRDGGGVYMGKSTVNFAHNTSFIGNVAKDWGGGVSVWKSSVSFEGDTTFTLNSASKGGGGACIWKTTSANISGSTEFNKNSAIESNGGGVGIWESNVVFVGSSYFRYNGKSVPFVPINPITVTVDIEDGLHNCSSGRRKGGGVYACKSNLTFVGDAIFVNNTASYGGGICADRSVVDFDPNNTGGQVGGAVNERSKTTLSFYETSNFTYNQSEYGRGPFVGCLSNVTFNRASVFTDNTATYAGGGIFIEDSNITLFGMSNFSNNAAHYFGGCVSVLGSALNLSGRNSFTNNSARHGGCIYVESSNILFNGPSNVFAGNSAINAYGGAIDALYSNLTFNEQYNVRNNSARYGGAISLSDSKIYLFPNVTMRFEGNHARRGGAIFIEGNPFGYCIFDAVVKSDILRPCFFQVVGRQGCRRYESSKKHDEDADSISSYDIQLIFQANEASEAGSVLYGGSLDSCGVCTSTPTNDERYISGETAYENWWFKLNESNLSSSISSDPFRVCLCNNNQPNCTEDGVVTKVQAYPGETIQKSLLAVGQLDGPVPSILNVESSAGILLPPLQDTQKTSINCTSVDFTVTRNVSFDIGTLTLYAEGPCLDLAPSFNIVVTFKPCPPGFSISADGICDCTERLQSYGVVCQISTKIISRQSDVWVGFDNQSDSLILHPHCPFDYCKPNSSFTMDNTDLQCNHHRSGHLCGACQSGLSLALGSSRCLPCSNKYLALIIPFIFAGLALVIFLFISQLTVAVGTINGLIFYANIIGVNRGAFFPYENNNVLTVFIAWLNLDLGIETCFFDGMDAYAKTWLQFVFPIYIWLLVGLITFICNVSTRAARILGSANPIATLATLFLLSYTKLLRTIIITFSFGTLEYPEGKVVWLYDGNIGYLDTNDGEFIVLFLASLLVFLFLFLPYTLFLLFGQCIHPRLNIPCLSRANNLRFKSLLEAYHAPYKDKHRYWIGLLLLARIILFLVSAIVNMVSSKGPYVNLLLIAISMIGLQTWAWNAGGMYKKWYLNALESSFILNLAVLAVATLYVELAGGDKTAVFNTSASIALITFIGIVMYHLFYRLKDVSIIQKTIKQRKGNWRRKNDTTNEEKEGVILEATTPGRVTTTIVDIREDKRKREKMAAQLELGPDSNELREPLLEMLEP